MISGNSCQPDLNMSYSRQFWAGRKSEEARSETAVAQKPRASSSMHNIRHEIALRLVRARIS